MKPKDIIIMVVKTALFIWIWENHGLLYGVLGWLAIDLLFIGAGLLMFPKQREALAFMFMSGVRSVELQLFGHTNDFKPRRKK